MWAGKTPRAFYPKLYFLPLYEHSLYFFMFWDSTIYLFIYSFIQFCWINNYFFGTYDIHCVKPDATKDM